jgi:hypothetical protein
MSIDSIEQLEQKSQRFDTRTSLIHEFVHQRLQVRLPHLHQFTTEAVLEIAPFRCLGRRPIRREVRVVAFQRLFGRMLTRLLLFTQAFVGRVCVGGYAFFGGGACGIDL